MHKESGRSNRDKLLGHIMSATAYDSTTNKVIQVLDQELKKKISKGESVPKLIAAIK